MSRALNPLVNKRASALFFGLYFMKKLILILSIFYSAFSYSGGYWYAENTDTQCPALEPSWTVPQKCELFTGGLGGPSYTRYRWRECKFDECSQPCDLPSVWSNSSSSCEGPPPPLDTDGDGIPDNEDTDLDGDGILNNQDFDSDGDGASNSEDPYPNDPTNDPDRFEPSNECGDGISMSDVRCTPPPNCSNGDYLVRGINGGYECSSPLNPLDTVSDTVQPMSESIEAGPEPESTKKIERKIETKENGNTVEEQVVTIQNSDGTSRTKTTSIINRLDGTSSTRIYEETFDSDGNRTSHSVKGGDSRDTSTTGGDDQGEGEGEEEAEVERKSSGGDSCLSPPSCSGDEIDCANLRQLFLLRCPDYNSVGSDLKFKPVTTKFSSSPAVEKLTLETDAIRAQISDLQDQFSDLFDFQELNDSGGALPCWVFELPWSGSKQVCLDEYQDSFSIIGQAILLMCALIALSILFRN